MEELNMETNSQNEESAAENTGEILIGEIQSKQEKRKKHKESFSDILLIQFTICIIVLLIITAANIVRPGSAMRFAERFCEITNGGPEGFIQDTAQKAVKLIHD